MSSSDDEFGPEISFGRMRSLPFFGQMGAPQINEDVTRVMEENARLKQLVQQMRQQLAALESKHRAHVQETAPMVKEYKHDKKAQLNALSSFLQHCTQVDPNGTLENNEFKTNAMWYAMSWGVILPETLVTRRMGELGHKLEQTNGKYVYRGRKFIPNLLPFAGPYQNNSSPSIVIREPTVSPASSPMSSPGSPVGSPVFKSNPTQIPSVGTRR